MTKRECKVENQQYQSENLQNVENEVLINLKESDKYALAQKIEDLNECNSEKIWITFFDIAFDKLGIGGETIKEKYIKASGISLEGELLIENLNNIRSKLVEKLKEVFLKETTIEIIKNYNDLTGIKIDNSYNSLSYNLYVSNVEEKLLSKFNDFLKEQKDNLIKSKISSKEFKENVIEMSKKIGSQIKDEILYHANNLRIFEKEQNYFSQEMGDFFDKAIENGIRFRKVGDILYSYNSDGIFLNAIKIPIENNDEYFKELIEKYGSVKLKDIIKIEVDQEEEKTKNYVSDTTFLDNIKIPREYGKKLLEFEKKGFSLKLVALNGNQFNIIVKKDGFVVYDINNSIENDSNKLDLWLDVLIFNLEKISKINKKDKINLPTIDIKNFEKQKINFINEIYGIVYDKEGNINEGLDLDNISIEKIINIGIKNKLPLKIILLEIPSIFNNLSNSLSNKGVNIFGIIIDNLDVFLPNSPLFLNKFNIREEKYFDIKNSFIGMYFNLWQSMILQAPEKSLEKIIDITNNYAKRDINFSINSLEDLNGTNFIIIFVLRKIISVNPDLFEDEKIKKLFERIPGLKEVISNGIEKKFENKQLLGNMSGGSQEDFDKSVDYDSISRIIIRIKNEWIEEYIENKREILEIKLAIARNLYIQYKNNIEKLNNLLNENPEKLIKETLEEIINKRKEIENNTFFERTDLFHIAHFGQDIGFDNFGTLPTQTALKKQAGGKSYQIFDAKDIFNTNIENGKLQLEKFYNQFVTNKGPAMLITEGHGNNEIFSVLNRYKESDKLGINKIGNEMINIGYKKLADIVIKRQKYKKENGIIGADTIFFAACRGDYAMNFYNELENRKNELGDDFIPPIMVTAAESGQNSLGSIKNLETEIPGQIFRYTFDIGSEQKSTFGTFFKNQHRKEMGSNPSMFYPIKINGKWFPQQLG